MPSTPSDNKEVIRRMNDEVWAESNLDLVDEYVAEDYVEHNTASPEEIHGPEGYKENVRMLRGGFSNVEVTTEHLVAEGDKVCNHYTITATHDGEFMGIEPTGNEVSVSGMAIARFEDGKLVEDWSVIDVMGLMVQLGVVEPPGE